MAQKAFVNQYNTATSNASGKPGFQRLMYFSPRFMVCYKSTARMLLGVVIHFQSKGFRAKVSSMRSEKQV